MTQSAQFLNRHLGLELDQSLSIEHEPLSRKIIGLSEAPFELVNSNLELLKPVSFAPDCIASYFGYIEEQESKTNKNTLSELEKDIHVH